MDMRKIGVFLLIAALGLPAISLAKNKGHKNRLVTAEQWKSMSPDKQQEVKKLNQERKEKAKALRSNFESKTKNADQATKDAERKKMRAEMKELKKEYRKQAQKIAG